MKRRENSKKKIKGIWRAHACTKALKKKEALAQTSKGTARVGGSSSLNSRMWRRSLRRLRRWCRGSVRNLPLRLRSWRLETWLELVGNAPLRICLICAKFLALLPLQLCGARMLLFRALRPLDRDHPSLPLAFLGRHFFLRCQPF
ncbi:hypothetical protein PIB30_013542 [Stylosanthes scabra]|uniref:Uncharacterized protein n=1 Tax=Stylosanthes scabra TaxID=79078 RepID=A0ABU6R6M3_9FABA|nr:hypothetical protein [Stylosanthes scabra]